MKTETILDIIRIPLIGGVIGAIIVDRYLVGALLLGMYLGVGLTQILFERKK